jgi:aspartate 1-decarboxylase
MKRTLLGGKIHRARVTAADVNYVGSITIDMALAEAAGMMAYERVQVVDVDNGARLETYLMPGPGGSGVIQLNGAAAHLVSVGDRVIVMSYVVLDESEARHWEPRVVLVDDQNGIVGVRNGEREALLSGDC